MAVAGFTALNFAYYVFMLVFWPFTRERNVRHLLKNGAHRALIHAEDKR